MAEFPKQRVDQLITSEAGEDLLVYDQQREELHALKTVVVDVWNACDGQRSIGQISAVTGFDHGVVEQALGYLSAANLLMTPFSSVSVRQNRRKLLKAGAGAAIAVPAIISISAPAAANHQSGQCHPGGTPCSVDADCCGQGGASMNQFCMSVPGAGLYCGGFVE